MEGKVWHTCLHLYSTPFIAFFLYKKLKKEPRQRHNIPLCWWFEPGWDRRWKKYMKNPSVWDARKKTQHVEEELILRMNGDLMFLLNPHWKRCDLGLLCLLFLVSWGYVENMLLYIQVNRNSSLLNWGQLHLWERELMRTRKGVQRELGDFLGSIHVLFYNEKAKWKLTCFSGCYIEKKKEIMLFKLLGGIKYSSSYL